MTDKILDSLIEDLSNIKIANGYNTDVVYVDDIIQASEHLSRYASQAAVMLHWSGFSVSGIVDQGVGISDTFVLFLVMANEDQKAMIALKEDVLKALFSNRSRDNYAMTTRVLSGNRTDILTEGKFEEMRINIQVDWIRADE